MSGPSPGLSRLITGLSASYSARFSLRLVWSIVSTTSSSHLSLS